MAVFAWIGLGRRRAVVVGVRPAGVVPRARRAQPARAVSRDRDRGDRVHHSRSAYNQVIELFPSGGGGYKVAHEARSVRYAGLVAGRRR